MQEAEEAELKGSHLHKYCSRQSVVFATLPIGKEKQQNTVQYCNAQKRYWSKQKMQSIFNKYLVLIYAWLQTWQDKKACAQLTATKCQALPLTAGICLIVCVSSSAQSVDKDTSSLSDCALN